MLTGWALAAVVCVVAFASTRGLEVADQGEEQDLHNLMAERERRFYAWEGGKRADEAVPEIYYGEEPKRKFYAWAGKRAEEPFEEEEEEKRKFFNRGGAKRDPPTEDEWEIRYPEVEERKYFGNGKRNPTEAQMDGGYPREAFEAPEERKYFMPAKRYYEEPASIEERKFYAWAGKRAEPLYDTAYYPAGAGYDGYERDTRKFFGPSKRKFYAWAGKRAEPPFYPVYEELPKRKFYAWAGRK